MAAHRTVGSMLVLSIKTDRGRAPLYTGLLKISAIYYILVSIFA